MMLSAPKLSAVNASAFEWWYFDAVAAHNPNLSAVITFFTSSPAAFPMAPRNGSSVVWSYVYVSLPDAPAPPPPPPGDEGRDRDGDGDGDGGTGGGSGGNGNDRGDKGDKGEKGDQEEPGDLRAVGSRPVAGDGGRVVSEIGVAGEESEGIVLGDGGGWNVGFWEGLGGWVASSGGYPGFGGEGMGRGKSKGKGKSNDGKSKGKGKGRLGKSKRVVGHGDADAGRGLFARSGAATAAAAAAGPNLEVWVGWEGSRISGRLRLENATSPRTPCTTSQRFDPSLRLGSVGWVNIVPHAKATVDLIVDGEAVKFEGYGYHDKNWSERPFHSLVKKWFWGHAHVGPYSLVWFQETPLNSTIPVASASVLKDGVTVLSGCEAGIVSVQRVGHAAASGFAVEVVMRGVRVTMLGTREVAGDGQHFFRWTGTVDGEVLGQKVNGGVAVFEEFDL
ncbi:uncharacterized protein BO66DRAFT_471520 [Aspergillus aculeatinus CBS 121060]|uniref:Uncharacterized protein n=1 Tax=Aspergillus aculeatinus CBS 121060 TaxID=1448322 RepID=A0ACD1H9W8_9EURO|nr:hypothetical protein BO66DRAFT_471520 [Aspergillus aculeatinus CBS 121060]RAH70213.1 hypothetical protein BO66DRAFT_471520 [Aspergillus aculeatinus CBS 121060]